MLCGHIWASRFIANLVRPGNQKKRKSSQPDVSSLKINLEKIFKLSSNPLIYSTTAYDYDQKWRFPFKQAYSSALMRNIIVHVLVQLHFLHKNMTALLSMRASDPSKCTSNEICITHKCKPVNFHLSSLGARVACYLT